MKGIFLLFFIISFTASAQFKSATIQIDGLTCSMCSLGVERAIRKLKFIEKVKVDLNSNTADIQFKPGIEVSILNLARSVKDAGFSVRTLTASFDFKTATTLKSDYFYFGDDIFYVLNNNGNESLTGVHDVTFLDKHFTDDSSYKKYGKTIEAKRDPLAFKDYHYFVLL